MARCGRAGADAAAHRGVSDRDLVELCEPDAGRLAELSGETINLGVPTSLGVEHLAQVDSSHFIGATNWLGRRVPLHTNALGKVFLAFGAARLPRGPLEQLTPATVPTAGAGRPAQQIRAQGLPWWSTNSSPTWPQPRPLCTTPAAR